MAGWEDDKTSTLETIRRRYVLYVLELAKGNCNAAARILDVDRKTLYRRLKRWGVERRKYQHSQ